ncbi:MAG: helix-turn-helix domain-containing protein [Xanthomonadales bacterium]|nr:helix-turn-helix domain-containing protein [Xanthomonadales bacterium]
MHSSHSWRTNSANDLFDTQQAAEYLGLKRTTLEAWRCRGGGPKFAKFGRVVRYRQSDIDSWIESRTRDNTVQPDP